jgi:glutamine cyclotransferase
LEEKIIIDQNGRNVYNMNELEYVVNKDGKPFIYANVYMERRIVKIDIVTGRVVKEYDLLKVIQNEKALKYDEVINGIAFHESSGKFLLTGKNWGNFYLVSLD